jgi:hypothetical protein
VKLEASGPATANNGGAPSHEPPPGKRTRTSKLPAHRNTGIPVHKNPGTQEHKNTGTDAPNATPLDDPFGLHLIDEGPACHPGDTPFHAANACGPHVITPSPNAFSGIEPYVAVTLPSWNMSSTKPIGPSAAGAYNLEAYFDDGYLMFYLAWHRERRQQEWVIGPDKIDDFVATVGMWEGAALNIYPGSKNVAHSTAAGADQAPHIPSMAELDGAGRAPYQHDQGEGFSFPSAGTAGKWLAKQIVDPGAAGMGRRLSNARDAQLRLKEYVRPAEELAKELEKQLDAGGDHMELRQQAAEGRNDLLRGTREKQSPAARAASRALKNDKGLSLSELEADKVRKLLDKSSRADGAKLRSQLARDSELWQTYRDALKAAETSGERESTYQLALASLGKSPEVSREIIRSAGRPNKFITAIARGGRYFGAVTGAIGALDVVATIWGAEEGERWHVAAGELSCFAGGMLGGEAGAVFLVSALLSGAGGPITLVVSVIGGIVGSLVGVNTANGRIPKMLTQDVLGPAIQATLPMTTRIEGGGYAGEWERDQRRMLPQPKSTTDRIYDLMWTIDNEELPKIEKDIAEAPDHDRLELYQRGRVEMLRRREELGIVYAALRSHAITEQDLAGPQECSIDETQGR